MEANDILDAVVRLDITRDINEYNMIVLEEITISRLYLEGLLQRILTVNWNLQNILYNLEMKKG